MTRGRLIAVVGPSGVGKDTLMRAMIAGHPGLRRARRVITRAPDPEGEGHEAVSETEFDARLKEGGFALHWRAHGLRYGVPVGICLDLAAGRDLLVNLSRSVLPEAQARFQPFVILHLTATSEVLAARLAGRGRETHTDIAERLSGADLALPEGVGPVITLDTDAALPRLTKTALKAIYAVKV
ncbi:MULTISPECIES: phosphonate metabolism protein/1,5-bisphosphokinase (PRPP-forming) PhnN [unclassified Roseovarius]|jgi:ribose 1,5-bisphosphokinase|uniref:phosphonate metabolism protein/1,5-bisphosphokinase (PRPP-forming) PhnN n=1 Tax=unclassified Roseovarius TaxID=2614913 RepID=UPI000068628A|nr:MULTISPECIES: phosphonate metabolism protein/1,5-bisphosphokinase (PRPP-forming) PhnN [unclassified Roseovarius]EAQ25279.1 alkylphosphonate utilization protein PhnN [Roseovarius sp. 217]KJS44189.1 MAG: ribose-phosphate pyrophosphokinase [Roseovarius sp. BRH_c41]